MRELLGRFIQPAFVLEKARFACACRHRIRRDLKRTIDSCARVVKAPQISVKFAAETAEQLEVPRIQFERLLKRGLGFLPKAKAALNECQILQQVGIIRQSYLRLLVSGNCAREVA